MAECPLKKSVAEKGPDKIRLKCSLGSTTSENNVDGNGENKPHECEMPKTDGQEEAGGAKTEEDLMSITESELQSLLQEASQPLYDRNSEKSKLLRKVIDETDFKDSQCQANLVGKASWCSRRDGRRFERRTRLDSYGHGNSAAACTTQGGSLQNLHGKPESKKSLHKSGSLITFPAGGSLDSETRAELDALKQFLTKTVAETSARPRRNSGHWAASVAAAEPPPSSRECLEGGEGYGLEPVGACDGGPVHRDVKTFERGRGNILEQKSFSKSTEEEEDEEDIEEIEMMDIDRNADDQDSETLPLIRNGPVHASEWGVSRPYGSLDGCRSGRSSRNLEVDASVSMPLMLKPQQSSSYPPTRGTFINSGNFVDQKEYRYTSTINDRRKYENEEGKTTVSSRQLDENGNPRNTLISYFQDSHHRDPPDRDGHQASESADSNHRRRLKKVKVSSKLVDLNHTELPGYFGTMPIEDILKRINSSEDLNDEKLNVGVDPKKKAPQKDLLKPAGTRIKKMVASREVSKKNLENDMGRMNGSKENIIRPGFKEALLDGIADKEGQIALKSTFNDDIYDQMVADKMLKPKNEALAHLQDYELGDKKGIPLESLSRLMKPRADINIEAFPLSTFQIKEDGASKYPDAEDVANHVNSEEADEKSNSVFPVSSFVEDFYSNPEVVQSVLEDSEFCEVKKKKKNKPRSAKNDGAPHYRNYSYASSGGDGSTYSGSSGSSVVNEDGRRTQPASWANMSNLSHHFRAQCGSEELRRKSTSSVPPSEHSSADNSDVESVHSLPVSSTVPKTVVNKTSCSSSCTPQASYADIAKMTSSRRTQNPFRTEATSRSLDSDVTAPLSPPAETKRDASTSTAEGSASPPPPCCERQNDALPPPRDGVANSHDKVETSNISNAESRQDVALEFFNSKLCAGDENPVPNLVETAEPRQVAPRGVIWTSGASEDVPTSASSVEKASRTTATQRPRIAEEDPAICVPGVVFVGALDMPMEDLTEVTFGFEVNEELVRMTAALRGGFATVARTDANLPFAALAVQDDTNVYHFTSSGDEVAAPPPADDGASCEARAALSPREVFPDDTQYFNYQNVVDFIGRAWDGVQEELEEESQRGTGTRRAKVQYYTRKE